MPKVLAVRARCSELVAITEISAVISLCMLYDSYTRTMKLEESDIKEEDKDTMFLFLERLFVFCVLWSVGGAVKEEGRKEVDSCIRDIESGVPPVDTVYEYYVSMEKKDWSA